jgi:hypothetical protein
MRTKVKTGNGVEKYASITVIPIAMTSASHLSQSAQMFASRAVVGKHCLLITDEEQEIVVSVFRFHTLPKYLRVVKVWASHLKHKILVELAVNTKREHRTRAPSRYLFAGH